MSSPCTAMYAALFAFRAGPLSCAPALVHACDLFLLPICDPVLTVFLCLTYAASGMTTL